MYPLLPLAEMTKPEEIELSLLDSKTGKQIHESNSSQETEQPKVSTLQQRSMHEMKLFSLKAGEKQIVGEKLPDLSGLEGYLQQDAFCVSIARDLINKVLTGVEDLLVDTNSSSSLNPKQTSTKQKKKKKSEASKKKAARTEKAKAEELPNDTIPEIDLGSDTESKTEEKKSHQKASSEQASNSDSTAQPAAKKKRIRKKQLLKSVEANSQLEAKSSEDHQVATVLGKKIETISMQQSQRGSISEIGPDHHHSDNIWEMTTTDDTSVRTHSRNDQEPSNENEKCSCLTPTATPGDMSDGEEEGDRGKLSANVLTRKLKRTLEQSERRTQNEEQKSSFHERATMIEAETKLSNKSQDSCESTLNHIFHDWTNASRAKHNNPAVNLSLNNFSVNTCQYSSTVEHSQKASETSKELTSKSDELEGFIEVKPSRKKAPKPSKKESKDGQNRRKQIEGASTKQDKSDTSKRKRFQSEFMGSQKGDAASESKPLNEATAKTTKPLKKENNELNKSSTSAKDILVRANSGQSSQHVSKAITRASADTESENKQKLAVSKNQEPPGNNRNNNIEVKCVRETEGMGESSSSNSGKKIRKPLRLNPKASPITLTMDPVEIENINKANLERAISTLFQEKVNQDIIRYVEKVTKEANEIMTYRIIAFDRLSYVISNSFKSKLLSFYIFD